MDHSTIIGIVDLPTELLLEIGAWITLADPHHRSVSLLAQTCRRFSALFKPQIISHIASCVFQSRKHPCDANITTTSRILWEKPLKSIRISFKQHHTFDNIRCFRGLIFHTRHLESIIIDLCSANFDSRVLACLLDSCVQRPDVELTITETGARPSARPGGLVHQRISMWQDTMNQRNTTIIKYGSGNGTLRFNATPHFPRYPPQLSTLNITGDTLFNTIMYPWTLHILNTAPLTCLSITKVQLSISQWSRILPLISIPTLTHLAIGSILVGCQDLLAFLARHPRLETIDLSNNSLVGSTSFPSSISKSTFLPNLTLMIAPLSYIDVFDERHQQGYCPRLAAFRNAHITVRSAHKQSRI